MTQHSWFFDGVSSEVNEAEWVKFGQYFLPNGVFLDADTNFGLNKLEPYASGADANVLVKTGRAWNHGHAFENDAEFVQAVTANATGSTRVDRIVLRANRTTNTVVLTYLDTGQPSAGLPPALSNTATIVDIPICQITADPSFTTIAAAKVLDERLISVGIDGVGGNRIKLFDTTLAAAAAQIDCPNIPASFWKLQVETYAQGNTAVTFLATFLEVNGDTTAANYSEQYLLADDSTIQGARINPASAGIQMADIPGQSAAAGGTNQWMNAAVDLPGYSLATRKKWRMETGTYRDSSVVFPRMFRTEGTWDSVAVINRLRLFQQGAVNFKAGSRMIVYGVR